MVASPFIAPYLPVESPSFRFSHSYIFKINRLYDILENELNQNKLISGLMGELNIAVTYLLIKEHARVCQSAPCMFYCIRLSFFLKMYKFDFFLSMWISAALLFVPVFLCCSAATLSFFSFSGGLGNSPTSGIGYIVFIQCTPIPCLLLFGIFLTGKIHFSEPRRK